MADTALREDARKHAKTQTGTPHLFLVYNPVAGADDAGAGLEKARERLETAGWRYTIYETTGKESLPDVVRQAVKDGYDLVAAGGGDGTVSMVAGGLVHTQVPLAILPMGSGNVIAQELEIPQNTADAVDLLIGEHAIRRIDAMQVEDKYFFLTGNVGLSTGIIDSTRREQKRRFGFLAYLWNAALQLGGFRLRYFALEIDGERFHGWASEVLVANCGILGMKWVRSELGIHPDDGVLEVCVVRSRTVIDFVDLAWNFFVLRRKGNPEVQCFQAQKSVKIASNDPILVGADGEILGQTPVEFKVVPGALHVVVPTAQQEPVEAGYNKLKAALDPLFRG